MKRYKSAILTTIALVVAVVLGLLPNSATSYYPPCVFHKLTGIPCPGCGTTRAWRHLMHGHFYDALYTNPLVLIAEVGFIVYVVWLWVDTVRGSNSLDKVMHFHMKPWMYVLVGVLVLANWVWSIQKGI
ncbi:MAG: DUF2752 domain-containing protein [Bacteroidales bacterium]|nr:DUF2752 domain-containing protein [Bacteroidales bacterium]